MTDSFTPLGTIYLPSNPGTMVGKFDFIVDPTTGQGVEIGTPVAAETSEGTVVGAVIDMRTVGLGKDPVASDLGNSYDAAYIANIPEVIVATVQVFYSKAMRPVRAGVVRAASAKEMLQATGFDNMSWPIPAGVVSMSDGSFAKVCFDGHALLGPESAHLMIGGLSGQAAKTSFASTLLHAAINSGSESESVGAIIFNVKGEDLIYMDEPPAEGYALSERDLAIYEALDIPAEPFKNVTVYSPALPGGGATRSPRADALELRWDLPMVWKYLRYLFPYLADDEKWQSFRAEFEELKLYNTNARETITTFKQLSSWMDSCIRSASEETEDGSKGSSMAWRSHHVASFRRFKRMLTSLPSRCGGLLSQESADAEQDVPVHNWKHGQVIVVDLAGLHTDVQALVIARTCERLLESAESGELGVDHCIVFADELNAFAPAQGAEMAAVKKILQRIATQGRYAGISIWGAAQALSKVEPMLTTNAATRALGVTSDIELASGAYGRLASGLSERIATLPKGQMALWHYSFRSALITSFPRPAWKTGKPKTSGKEKPTRPKATDILKLSKTSLANLTEGISKEVADKIIADADSKDEAVKQLEEARIPDTRRSLLHEESKLDLNNPFGLDED